MRSPEISRKEFLSVVGGLAAVLACPSEANASIERPSVKYTELPLPEGMAYDLGARIGNVPGGLSASFIHGEEIKFSLNLIAVESVAHVAGETDVFPVGVGSVVSFLGNKVEAYARGWDQWLKVGSVDLLDEERMVKPVYDGVCFLLFGESVQAVKTGGGDLAVNSIGEIGTGKLLVLPEVGIFGFSGEKSLSKVEPFYPGDVLARGVSFEIENVVCSGGREVYQEVVNEGKKYLKPWEYNEIEEKFVENPLLIPVSNEFQPLEGTLIGNSGFVLGTENGRFVLVKAEADYCETKTFGKADGTYLELNSILKKTGIGGWPWLRLSVAGGMKVLIPERRTYLPLAVK